MRAIRRISAALLLLGVPTLGTASAASAADVQPLKVHSCSVKANDPHWSRGGGSVIFKARVQCVISKHADVEWACDGWLLRNVGTVVRHTNHSGGYDGGDSGTLKRTIKSTFYVPRVDQPNVTVSGSYQGRVRCDFGARHYSGTDQDYSNTRLVNVP